MRSCRLPTTFLRAPKASPGESGIRLWLLARLLNDEVVGISVILTLCAEFWPSGLTVRTESKEVLSRAPARVLEVDLEVDRVILKELVLGSSVLSILAYFERRRCGCGMLNEVLRLKIGCGPSESDSVSSSSHNAGY